MDLCISSVIICILFCNWYIYIHLTNYLGYYLYVYNLSTNNFLSRLISCILFYVPNLRPSKRLHGKDQTQNNNFASSAIKLALSLRIDTKVCQPT